MKIFLNLLASFFLLFAGVAWAQQAETVDGHWIKKGINAFNRVYVTKKPSDTDYVDSVALVSYLSGMIAVHKNNNMLAVLLVSAKDSQNKQLPPGKKPLAGDEQLKVAFAFTPLLALPDKLSSEQVIGILQRYLEAHPEKWNTSAPYLITEALKEAFSQK